MAFNVPAYIYRLIKPKAVAEKMRDYDAGLKILISQIFQTYPGGGGEDEGERRKT